MTYGRAAIPALIGGLILTALLRRAGASTQALHLPGTGGALGGGTAAELERRPAPWAYDPPSGVRPGAETSGGTGGTAAGRGGDRVDGPDRRQGHRTAGPRDRPRPCCSPGRYGSR
ncbi:MULTISPECIES: hypothetical protein [unclassified Streptomyces]|uniref:hypothetical protein n=1 Tax=unclassified Streptomyces TaxID=2593676 RepID=UPI0033BBC873